MRKTGQGKRNVKGTRRKGGDSDSEDSEGGDNNSVANSLVSATVSVDNSDISDGLSEAVEKLSEKRASTRENGLKSVLKILRGSNEDLVDTTADYNENICTSLLRMIRKPVTFKEGALCLEVYCLLCLIAGPDEDELYKQFEQLIIRLVNGSSTFEELRVPAIAALAFSSYICSSEANFRVMTLCEDVLCGESEGEPATSTLKVVLAYSFVCIFFRIRS
jgi:hypothetical protein